MTAYAYLMLSLYVPRTVKFTLISLRLCTCQSEDVLQYSSIPSRPAVSKPHCAGNRAKAHGVIVQKISQLLGRCFRISKFVLGICVVVIDNCLYEVERFVLFETDRYSSCPLTVHFIH